MARHLWPLLCAASVALLGGRRVQASTLAFLPNEAMEDFDNPPTEADWIELCRDPQLQTSDVTSPRTPSDTLQPNPAPCDVPSATRVFLANRPAPRVSSRPCLPPQTSKKPAAAC
jgi:hypothetical protein